MGIYTNTIALFGLSILLSLFLLFPLFLEMIIFRNDKCRTWLSKLEDKARLTIREAWKEYKNNNIN
jgi:type III secretory pathway component EscR